jgi:hypothetical protein
MFVVRGATVSVVKYQVWSLCCRSIGMKERLERERESAEVEERESYVFDPVRCSTKARLHLTGQFDKAKATSQGRRCAQQDNDEEPGNGNNPVPPSDQDNGGVGGTNVQHAVGG